MAPQESSLNPKKILVLGPESSGKTTLVQSLAPLLDAFIVPEYFRFYWEAKRHTKDHAAWREEEFLHMAEEQNRFEDLYATKPKGHLLCDTAAWQLVAWAQYYLLSPSPQLLQLAQSRTYDLIFLCQPDIPFVQDGVRDGAHSRQSMHDSLTKLLTAAKLPFISVAGDQATRLEQARSSILMLS